MSELGRNFALDRFSYTRLVGDMGNLYRQLLDKA
jgi:hypothetical protein